MISEKENPNEAKRVCPGQPARHAKADPGRYFTQKPQCWFSRETAHRLQMRQNAPTYWKWLNKAHVYIDVDNVNIAFLKRLRPCQNNNWEWIHNITKIRHNII